MIFDGTGTAALFAAFCVSFRSRPALSLRARRYSTHRYLSTGGDMKVRWQRIQPRRQAGSLSYSGLRSVERNLTLIRAPAVRRGDAK